ncbi:hypothetical protein RND81_08G123000 [Saponaria officinalis]|uniref:Uncharacterized protein n=1 Tax=Saponaria officinalis TaxID=3572 RepID=A0AAW1J6G6_SAPOF
MEYYGKMKRTWESLDSLDHIPSCIRGVLEGCTCKFDRILDRESDAKLLQFLMGLNIGYEVVKTNVLLMEPLPPI